ncbi:unnamed protein product [Brachionus calyciflorus]|uniref:FAM20 C-terminal domain-containing protein n=1 Tax=Brachionus calyciflorus TaxID=104777 RepID=A0A813M8Y8_9BILA|nr:unnamed protein product [Brachionus calyciflorus]
MNLKLRRLVLNKIRHLSLARICLLVFLLIFLLTSYIYGLIEINSHQIIFNILPADINENDYVIDHDMVKNNPKIPHEPKKIIAQNKYSLTVDKKIKKLFSRVQKSREEIERVLNEEQRKLVTEQKNTYTSLIYERHEQLKAQLEKELERLKKEEEEKAKNNPNDNNANLNQQNVDEDDDDEEEEDARPNPKTLKLKTSLNSDEMVPRDQFINFLKLEKINRKLKHVKTVRELVDEYRLNDDANELKNIPSIWERYHMKISELQLYNHTKNVNSVLKSMASEPVINCAEKEKGTQIKLILTLNDGTDVLVKPMKVPRDYETPPDHFYFVDFERHHAEIAAFHVDRLLGFHRVPPTVGRVFNMTTELLQKAEPELERTFFISPGGNLCFTGHCSYYCDSTHATCGKPLDRLEGSVQLLLPSKPAVKWETARHPYRRTYTKKRKAEWEVNDQYCEETVFRNTIYHSKLFLDLIDLCVFDFITSNMDRHHFERMVSLGNDSFMIHLDNGRSFGKIFSDEMSILAPLKQCCLIRYSTFKRLEYLYENGFGKMLDESLKFDPLYPILTENHLISVDRRLAIILKEVMKCTDKFSLANVIIDDGY